MSKVEKRIEKWRRTKQDVPVSDLESVLDHYLKGYWEKKVGTSHLYQICHPKLIGMQGCDENGGFTISVKSGQKIRYWWIKKLVTAIDIINKQEE